MKKFVFLICIITVLLNGLYAYAYSAEDILNGEHDLLILGTVKDVDDDTVTVTVDNTVGKEVPSLKSGDIDIERFKYSYCEEHTTDEFNSPKIGDNIFASLSLKNGTYELLGGAYKVDSSEIKNTCVIVYQNMKGEECLNDAVEISYFIRTNGKISRFETDDSGSIYAVNDDDKIIIYPLPGNESIKIADSDGKIISEDFNDDVMPIVPNSPMKENERDNRWIASCTIIALGAAVGVVFFYVLYAKKRI